jgi:hypothetical protein
MMPPSENAFGKRYTPAMSAHDWQPITWVMANLRVGPPRRAHTQVRYRGNSFLPAELGLFIHELFKKDDNAMIYLIKLKSPKKQSAFCTGWKACATRFFAAW